MLLGNGLSVCFRWWSCLLRLWATLGSSTLPASSTTGRKKANKEGLASRSRDPLGFYRLCSFFIIFISSFFYINSSRPEIWQQHLKMMSTGVYIFGNVSMYICLKSACKPALHCNTWYTFCIWTTRLLHFLLWPVCTQCCCWTRLEWLAVHGW